MKKFRLYFDKDKEETWLNEMSEQGWAMLDFFAGLYIFKPCKPGEYIYRVDMPGEIGRVPVWKKSREYAEYIELVEETGAEYVCRWGLWLIFRKEAAKGKFDLYTDAESQIGLYRRIRRLFLFVGILELSVALQNTGNILHFWNGLDMPGSFWHSGTNIFLFLALVFIYFVTAGFFFMSLRLTRKIKNLRK